jgi:hypothetical protein
MSPKKKVNKAEAKKTEKTIQYVAIAMIVIVIAIFAAFYGPKLMPAAETAAPVSGGSVGDVGSGATCALFDSIPAAEQYNEAPPMMIDQAKQYFATFKMAKE